MENPGCPHPRPGTPLRGTSRSREGDRSPRRQRSGHFTPPEERIFHVQTVPGGSSSIEVYKSVTPSPRRVPARRVELTIFNQGITAFKIEIYFAVTFRALIKRKKEKGEGRGRIVDL